MSGANHPTPEQQSPLCPKHGLFVGADCPQCRVPDIMPVQTRPYHSDGRLRKEVVLRAYEVYVHCYGEQRAMVEGGCRGGFSTGEIVAMLYARTFPREEWRNRMEEAYKHMELKA